MQINGKPVLKHDLSGCKGFTLIESAIVLVVIGTVLALGVMAWMSIKSGFEVSHTRAKLKAVKSCLMERMILSDKYPDFSVNLQEDEDNNYECENNVQTKAVDYCLCKSEYKDAWGRRIRFLGGIYDNGTTWAPINGKGIMNSDRRSFNATSFPGDKSNATNKDGGSVKNIVFILLSKGIDGSFDRNSTLHYFLPNATDVSNQTLAANLEEGTWPDFEINDKDYDDQVLIVTGNELSDLLP